VAHRSSKRPDTAHEVDPRRFQREQPVKMTGYYARTAVIGSDKLNALCIHMCLLQKVGQQMASPPAEFDSQRPSAGFCQLRSPPPGLSVRNSRIHIRSCGKAGFNNVVSDCFCLIPRRAGRSCDTAECLRASCPPGLAHSI